MRVVQFPDARKVRLQEIVNEVPSWLLVAAPAEMAEDILRIAASRAGFTPEEVEKIASGQMKIT